MTDRTDARTNRDERFSGHESFVCRYGWLRHESFVCRYGWLRKLFDAISSDPTIFADEESAILTLGIGKNMVRSIRFWGEAFSLMEGTPTQGYHPTAFSRCLLNEHTGLDPYLEDRNSLWLLHWKIATNANLAAWNVALQDIQDHQFTRKRFLELVYLRGRRGNKELAESTIKQHTDIFLHTYASMNHHYDAQMLDEVIGSPLQELGLLKRSVTDVKDDIFIFDIGPKRGLTTKTFLYALLDYWEKCSSSSKTLSLKEIMFGRLGPGAVFKLSEFDVLQYLDIVEDITDGYLQFLDSADVRSLHMRRETDPSSLKIRLGFDETRS
ncbi:conserved hypothetical protein [Syntrophobacter sp. SbD1]|nr:conserved hypothetical protein [Syntrophobacter sp. SbD1]